jgi:hypothetical protein
LSAGRPAAVAVVFLLPMMLFPSQLVVRPGAAVVATPDRSGQLPQLRKALQGDSERNKIFFALPPRRTRRRGRPDKNSPTVLSPLRRVGKQLRIPERRRRGAPQATLRRHRLLMAQKWDPSGIRTLVVRLASENPIRGCDGIQGVLANLGDSLADATVGSPLKGRGMEPAPGRKRQAARQTFLPTHRAFYRGEFRACESRSVNQFSGRTVPRSRLRLVSVS